MSRDKKHPKTSPNNRQWDKSSSFSKKHNSPDVGKSSQQEDMSQSKNIQPYSPNLNKQELFSEGVKLHERAIDGDKNAVKQAYELFKRIHELDPQDLLAEAYLGSLTSLLGRDGIDPNERLNLALKGVKILDGVIAKEPENIEIRSLRAYVNFNLPEMFFHRTAAAIKDFEYLLSRYEQNKNVFAEEFYWQVLFDLGLAYKRLDKKNEATLIWNKLLQVTTDPKYKKLVSQEKW
jgi:tetratricopeptide (TPR) repeat protein